MLTLKLSCTPDCDDCFTCGPGTHEEDGVCIPDEEADADTDTDVECGVVAFRRAYGDIWTMDEDGSNQTQVTASDDQKNYPSISPDCSQIELLWAKLKDRLRALAPRTIKRLEADVGTVLREITAKNCEAWFRHCGYVPQAS